MSSGSQTLWFGCSMKSQFDQSYQFIISKIKVGIQVTFISTLVYIRPCEFNPEEALGVSCIMQHYKSFLKIITVMFILHISIDIIILKIILCKKHFENGTLRN